MSIAICQRKGCNKPLSRAGHSIGVCECCEVYDVTGNGIKGFTYWGITSELAKVLARDIVELRKALFMINEECNWNDRMWLPDKSIHQLISEVLELEKPIGELQ